MRFFLGGERERVDGKSRGIGSNMRGVHTSDSSEERGLGGCAQRE